MVGIKYLKNYMAIDGSFVNLKLNQAGFEIIISGKFSHYELERAKITQLRTLTVRLLAATISPITYSAAMF